MRYEIHHRPGFSRVDHAASEMQRGAKFLHEDKQAAISEARRIEANAPAFAKQDGPPRFDVFDTQTQQYIT